MEMLKQTKRIVLAICVLPVFVGLAACGSGTRSEVVARVGSTRLTKGAVNHWMSTLAGGDFFEISHGHTVPAGLVSEPPNYDACASRLKAVAQRSRQSPPAQPQLLRKCRELYRALKLQATSFLVDSHWLMRLFSEEKLKATSREVMKLFNQVEAKEFPNELHQYLARRRRDLADELFLIKLDVLRQKAEKRLSEGGKQVLAEFTEAGQKWTARTSCSAGYVVQHCKQYTGESTSSLPSPAVLLEQVAVIAGIPCINRPACG